MTWFLFISSIVYASEFFCKSFLKFLIFFFGFCMYLYRTGMDGGGNLG